MTHLIRNKCATISSSKFNAFPPLHTRLWKLILVSEIVFFKEGHVSCNWGYIIGILYTWYGEPFCHQMGPYQTLRAETWWKFLQITFRVFFISRNPENQQNRSAKSRDVLFLEKKAPARKLACLIRVCIDQKCPHWPSLPSGMPKLMYLFIFWIKHGGGEIMWGKIPKKTLTVRIYRS